MKPGIVAPLPARIVDDRLDERRRRASGKLASIERFAGVHRLVQIHLRKIDALGEHLAGRTLEVRERDFLG